MRTDTLERIEGEPAAAASETFRQQVRLGFLTALPLWVGALPFGVTFAVLARTAGFSALETQALSVLVLAGSAQLAIVTLFGGGAGAIAILATTLMLNLRHILYAISTQARIQPGDRPSRPILAHFLMDEAYGLATREYLKGRGSTAVLFGAGLSLAICFNVATFIGIAFGSMLPYPERIGLDFIFPLSFLALLLPFLRSRNAVLVAAFSAVTVLITRELMNPSVAFMLTVIVAVTLGTLLEQRPGLKKEGSV